MEKKRTVMQVLSVVLFLAINGCGGMDIRVDRVEYDCCYKPRISLEQVRVFDKEPGPKFRKVADYIAQEEVDILIPRSMQEVINFAKEKAWRDGCEAIVIRDADTTNVSYQMKKGPVSRDRPKVKITGYRVNLN